MLPATPERYRILAGRLLRPASPCAGEAAFALAAGSGAQAWAMLASRGLTPPGERVFRTTLTETCARCRGRGRTGGYSLDPDDNDWICGHCESQGRLPASERDHAAPASVADAVALASDPAGLAQAEALVAEAAARLAVWGFRTGGPLAWRVGGPLALLPWGLGYELRILDAVLQSDLDFWQKPAYLAFRERTSEVRVGSFFERVQRHACGDQFWRQAAARGDAVRALYTCVGGETLAAPAALVGRPFAAVPNPFEPLLEVWALGYAPVQIAPGPLVLLRPERIADAADRARLRPE